MKEFNIVGEDTQQMEIILRCHHGMHFPDFRHLLTSIISARRKGLLKIHSSSLSCHLCDGHSLSNYCNDQFHIESDIRIAVDVLQRTYDD